MDNLTLKETIIPFCGKQCYNAINKLRNEKHKENDASDRKKAAEHVTALDSVLSCRPNMYAAYTNESDLEDNDRETMTYEPYQ